MSIRVFAPTDAPLHGGLALELDDEESRYLLDVRRARVGQTLELLDGERVWSARVVARAKRATLELDAVLERPTPPERIVLLGLPDPTATLEALTLASEAGASEVVLIACERSSAREPGSARVTRVLRAAQRQCGRPRVPLVHGLAGAWPLARALAWRSELPGWVAWEALAGRSDAHLAPLGGLRLLVGPEGGFAPGEVELITASFVPIALGPWILRTPTAVTAALARSWPA
jgi:16S rRNA (uracil1498-N3)-methyltransferase